MLLDSRAMSHDPSRRVFIGDLPIGTTRKDIVEFVRTRTRANPMYIEIGESKDGSGCFAHATVEGLRGVIEALSGTVMKGNRLRVEQARPHWSVPIMKLKKERELAEIAEQDAKAAAAIAREEARVQAACAALAHRREADKDDDPPLLTCHSADPESMPRREVFSSALKFAAVASQIAAELRQKHRERSQPPPAAVPPTTTTTTAARPVKRARYESKAVTFSERPKEIPLVAMPPAVVESKETLKLAKLKEKLNSLRQKLGKAA